MQIIKDESLSLLLFSEFDEREENPAASAAEYLRTAGTDAVYCALVRRGESFSPHALGACVAALEKNRERADAAAVSVIAAGERKKAAGKGKKTSAKILDLSKRADILLSPGCLEGIVMKTSAVTAAGPCGSIGELYARVLLKKKKLLYIPGEFFETVSPFALHGGFQEELTRGDWYLEAIRDVKDTILKIPGDSGSGENSDDAGSAPLYLQAQALYRIQILFMKNRNHLDKKALSGTQREQFFSFCRDCLEKIAPDLILPQEALHPDRHMPVSVRAALADLQGKEMRFPVLLCLTEYENDCLKLDIQTVPWLKKDGGIQVFLNGSGRKKVSCRPSTCYARTDFFGAPFSMDAWHLEIPDRVLEKDQYLSVCCGPDGKEALPFLTEGYCSRISDMVRGSYWRFAAGHTSAGENSRFMVSFPAAGEKQKIRIKKSGVCRTVCRELLLLACMPFGKNRSRRMFRERIRYWLAWPKWHRRNIWLTFDKLYKGGDCGEYFYRYLVDSGRGKTGKETENRPDPRTAEIEPVYVIRKDAPDRERLEKEGYHPVCLGTKEQRLSYLYARMVFATHSNITGFNGYNSWEIQFLQDRLRAVNTCIQHGLSIQDLTFDSNRLVNNNKRYYCASPFEIANLSRPAYDYSDDVLRLTGIPRYDGLENRDGKKILITPTWRAYLAMPAVLGSARPYNPSFRDSDYYRIYQELISDKKLLETAQRTGYQIIFLLHPVLSAQKQDFRAPEQVLLLSSAEADYEELLTQSSLMVTDYSGVQFDFAYMRKPLVYFHPPALPPHYDSEVFDYPSMGFGPVCTSREELVGELCEAMRRGCTLQEKYRDREDAFFAWSDRENCRRIFEDAVLVNRRQTG